MRTATAIAVSFAGWILASGALAADAFRLEILWSAPIVTDPSRQLGGITSAGLILDAQSTLPDGRIAFLARKVNSGVRSQALMTNVEQNSPDDAVTLTLRGALPAADRGLFSRIFSGPTQLPYVTTLAAGRMGEVWLGGFSNAYRDIASSLHSDAYLAKPAQLFWKSVHNR